MSVAKILRMTPAELHHSDVKTVLVGLRRAYEMLHEGGVRHSWLDAYVQIAEQAERTAADKALHSKINNRGAAERLEQVIQAEAELRNNADAKRYRFLEWQCRTGVYRGIVSRAQIDEAIAESDWSGK